MTAARSVIVFLSCFTVLFIAPVSAAETTKIALIITNKEYLPSLGRLENTHTDGERIAATLTKLGFAVVHKRDLGKDAMNAEVTAYIARLSQHGQDTVGFFYYAGHGAANSKHGDNYLIPVDANIINDAQLPIAGVKLGDWIDGIAATPAKTNFVVFDACRDVPISFSVRSAGRGMRKEPDRKGMLVAFATDPGKTATDEGVYAEALAEEMLKPGVESVHMFRAVKRRVLAATKEAQSPWVSDGLVDDFTFAQAQTAAVALQNTPATDTSMTTQTSMTLSPKSSIPDTSASTETALITPSKPSTSAIATTKAPVTDCDVYAAVKFDTERQAPGVDVGKIELAKAFPACNTAIKQYPFEKRFQYQLARAMHEAKDLSKAVALYRQLVDANYPSAMVSLADLYRFGNGVTQSKSEAIRLYRKASELGSSEAMRNLGLMYYNGEGVARDKVGAARFYMKAANLGNEFAMINLGYMYATGSGVVQNSAEAVRLYTKAAELGSAAAMSNLGFMYDKGQGVAQDNAKAVRYYNGAANLGHTSAMVNLGLMYQNGDGVAQNKVEAVRLYSKAAELGNAAAARNLGVIYDKGDGLIQDRTKAAQFTLIAIKKRDEISLNAAPYSQWSEEFRKELQLLLKKEGVYKGVIDGKANDSLKAAVQALARAP